MAMLHRESKDESPKAGELATRGWASRLAALVVALLLFEALSGLWIYLAPFSISAQLQVLLHTILGLALIGPFVWYQVTHFLDWYRQKMSVVMFLGYLLLLLVLICSVSGLVLTWQSAVGPRRSVLWNQVHLVSGIAATALLVAHVPLAWLRRRAAARQDDIAGRARAAFLRRAAVWLVVAGLLSGLPSLIWQEPQFERDIPEDYSLSDYVQQYDEYRGSPFAPSYARTSSGKLLDPRALTGSESCGKSGCHEQVLAEWQPSAHRFSAMNPPFQATQRIFAADREPAETRYCAGCHDPISLVAGAKDIANQDLTSPGTHEGSSCAVCHCISEVDQRGNADYVITPPRKYLWEDETGLKGKVSEFLVRAYPRQHLADYDRNLLRTPEFCAACHKQFIPEALNRYGLAASQNQYDEWRRSHWNHDDPQTTLSCRDCHMRLVHDSSDPGRGEDGDRWRHRQDGTHRHHGFIATNLFMPQTLQLPNWQQHVRLTEEWIKGETVIPEIEQLWPKGPVATLELIAPEQAAAGDEVQVRALVMNVKAGHNLITGPLDFMRAWIHLQVTDAHGQLLAEWGAVHPETRWICDEGLTPHRLGNPRDRGTMVLEGTPMNGQGDLLLRHELWQSAGGKGGRVIFPRYSDSQLYRFRLPEDVAGPITMRANLNFRRYRQQFLDLVVPEMERETGVFQPTVTKTSTTAVIQVQPPLAPTARTAEDRNGGGQ